MRCFRTYLREQEGLEHKADKFQVAALSHPDWLIKQIEQDWPEQALEDFTGKQPATADGVAGQSVENQSRALSASY